MVRGSENGREIDAGEPMLTMLKSKIHRATVTGADLEYEGSITIDRALMDAADLLPYEQVDIYDCTSGNRLSTYVIPGERESGRIRLNGAAAHLVEPGNVVIIACYVRVPRSEAEGWEARKVFVDAENRPRKERQRDDGERSGRARDGARRAIP